MVKNEEAVARCRTMPAIASFCLLISLNLFAPSWANLVSPSNANTKEPLIYTRLRFDRKYFNAILKPYQKQFTSDELLLQVTVNDSRHGNQDNGQIVHKYYMNPNVDINNITENDLILEALDLLYKSRLLHPYMQNFDQKEDRKRAADKRMVSQTRCNRELDYVMDKFNRITEARSSHRDVSGINPELATYFDSFGREESGLLLGNFNWVGNWRQCGLRHIFDPRNSSTASVADRLISFSGRYCVASIRAPAWKNKIMVKARQLRNNYFRKPNQFEEYKNFFRIQLGICLPESCDSTILDSRNEDIRQLATRNLRDPFTSYELADLYCLPDEGSELRQIDLSGWLWITFIACWLACMMLASYADYYNLCRTNEMKASKMRPQSMSQRFVMSMSLLESYQHLFKIYNRPDKELKGSDQTDSTKVAPYDMSFLHFFKVAFMPFIIMGHCCMVSHQYSKTPLDNDLGGNFWFHFQSGTIFFVDRYFCITGFITVYATFSGGQVRKYTAAHWLYSVFHRYWRLAPTYLIIFWFCRSLFQLTHQGPLWDYGTSNTSARAVCIQESWLTPLTLTSNWHALYEECILPAWYICSDFQFYLITPILLIILAKSAFLGWIIVLCLIAASLALRIQRYLTDPRVQPLELMRPHYDLYMRNNWDMYPTYLWPQYRVSAYLVGLLAGHYCYMVRSSQWTSLIYKQPDKSSGRTGNQLGAMLGWIALMSCLVINFITFAMDQLYPDSMEPYALYFVAIIYGNKPVITSFSFAILLVVLTLGYWKHARRLMGHPIWTILSRINYVVLLIHVEVLTWMLNSAEQVLSTMMWEQYRTWGVLFPLVYMLASIITLLLIHPLTRLEAEFLSPLFTDRPTQKVGWDNDDAGRLVLKCRSGSNGDGVAEERARDRPTS